MRAYKFFSMLVASVSIVFLLMALTTDYWLVAYGPRDITHSGLWQVCRDGKCFVPSEIYDYIQATCTFLIMASLAATISVLSVAVSFTPCDQGSITGSFVAAVAAFIGGLCTFVAVVVFTAESWGKNKESNTQLTFQWSFYLAWAAFPMLLLAGIFSLLVHLYSPRRDYESV
ncbi:protein NKG7-like [Tiliqua scincoides]|uniref:protein NKG7-like n=1 Tax=Tiliqua scincoides TaxID=71010 RepID=UPI0034627A2B